MVKRTAQLYRFLLVSVCFLVAVYLLPVTGMAQSFNGTSSVVMAGTLDDRSRVLFFTHDRNVWITYDTELGNLYSLWVGGLEDPSLLSPSFLAESPSLQGLILMENEREQNWRLIRKGEVITPAVSFLGYRWAGDQLVLRYALETSYGQQIEVEERPKISANRDQPVLERSFSVFNAPPDVQVGLEVSVEKIKDFSDLKVEGVLQKHGEKRHSYYWGTAVDVHGRLVLNSDTTTSITIAFSPETVSANIAETLELESNPIPRLRSIQAIESEGILPVLRRRADHEVGISMRLYGIGEPIEKIAELAPGQLPNVNQVISQVDLTQKDQFGGLDFYFITHLSGYLNIASPGEFFFRVLADDGIRLTVADSVILEKDGLQPAQPSEDVSITLPTGIHPIEIEHFQSTGKKQLTVMWLPPWRNTFDVLGAPILSTRKEKQRFYSASRKYVKRPLTADEVQTSQVTVNTSHPSIELKKIDVPELDGFVGGIDVLSSGKIVATTWKSDGRVMILDGDLDSASTINVKEIASGLNKTLGLKVVDDEIFVLQQHELTQLIDNDGNELIDEYRVVSNKWELSNDYTELAVGLEYDQGYFLGVLGMPLDKEGAILIEDIHHRGILVRIGFDGRQQIIEANMQLSGGISMDNGQVAISDQRNPWFSDSRVLFMPDTFNASGEGTSAGAASLSSIWLPVASNQNPAQPFYLSTGPYEGDWIVGDMVSTDAFRLSIDPVKQQVQGAVFPFSANLPVSLSRFVELPDGSFAVTGASLSRPWGEVLENSTGIYRVTLEDKDAFEMKTIRSIVGGFEIEFTRPVDPAQLQDVGKITLNQWPNSETLRDRTRKRGSRERVPVNSIEVLEDGRTARISVSDIKAGHIVYFNLDPSIRSADNERLWSNEAWYSLNELLESVSDAP